MGKAVNVAQVPGPLPPTWETQVKLTQKGPEDVASDDAVPERSGQTTVTPDWVW